LLCATPQRRATKTGDETFLVNRRGLPYTRKGLINIFCRWFNQAGLSHCTSHSLRKGSATCYAENGATDYELCAIFGFGPAVAAKYVKKANQKKTAERLMRRVHRLPIVKLA
jgi:integrase